MKNILSDTYEGPRLPRQVQIKRIQNVLERELTDCQREILTAYYFGLQTMEQIALQRGVNKSTVCRTLQRAEKRIRRCLRY